LPHTSKKDAKTVAERLLNNLRKQEFTFGSELVKITASIGCAGNTDVSSGHAEDLVKAADLALYEAKNSGRNAVVMYHDPTDEALGAGSLPPPIVPFPPSMPAPTAPFIVQMPAADIHSLTDSSSRPAPSDESHKK
jgi:hypothetical protein